MNAGDEELSEEEQKRLRQLRAIAAHEAERVRHGVIERLMAEKDGREFMCWLLDLTNIYRPVEDDHAEGARRVGLVIQSNVLAASPTNYYQLMVENAERIRDGAR